MAPPPPLPPPPSKKNYPCTIIPSPFYCSDPPSPSLPLKKGRILLTTRAQFFYSNIRHSIFKLLKRFHKKHFCKSFIVVWKFDQLANFIMIKINCKVWFNDSQFAFYNSSWSFHESWFIHESYSVNRTQDYGLKTCK